MIAIRIRVQNCTIHCGQKHLFLRGFYKETQYQVENHPNPITHF